jgi:hypothetical protein
VTQDSNQKVSNEIYDIVKPMKPKKILVDVRALKMPRTRLDAYYHAMYFKHFRVKTAIVDVADNAEYESFLEDTSNKIGLIWKWFTDIDAARAWLNSE